MDEIPPTPPPPQIPGSGPVQIPLKTKPEKIASNWPRLIFNSIVVLVIVLIFWAPTLLQNRGIPAVRQKEAQVMSVAIRTATQHFLADNGKLPLPVGGAPAKGDLDTDSSVMPGLVAVLIGKEPPGSARQNPRGTNYLDGIKPAKPGKKATGPPWINGLTWDSALSQYSVVDGWGNTYRIRLDTDGDGLVENPCIDEVAEGRARLPQRVIVWSPGKDGKDETWEDNPKSWD